jgi:hypothetical protein
MMIDKMMAQYLQSLKQVKDELENWHEIDKMVLAEICLQLIEDIEKFWKDAI